MTDKSEFERNIERFEQATADLREAVREAHAATKDLRAATKEGRALLSELVPGAIKEHVSAELHTLMESLDLKSWSGRLYNHVQGEVWKLVNIVIYGNEAGTGKALIEEHEERLAALMAAATRQAEMLYERPGR